jgi:geranylgeranyl pyrophosphate synthase
MELARVLEPIAGDLAAVEGRLAAVASRIASSGQAPSGILEEISRHPFAVPGKRLRPALVLLAARAGDGAGGPSTGGSPAAVGLAAAVEVLHAASLVHDDIIDGAEERRHQVSLNKRFGNRVAVLAGDILYTEFFTMVTELLVEAALRSRILALFLATTRKMCVGEILAQEVEAARRSLGFEEYLEISEDKTASLFASCCEGGALVGGSGDGESRSLGEFGRLFGLTFQMLDDLADRDHGLDPGVDLRARTEEYGRLTRSAAGALGKASSAPVSALLDYVLGQALTP